MPEEFLNLTSKDREDALNFAASTSGRPANLLEKDVWVVKALDVLFSSQFGPHLVFKGGTALSKAHRVIDRFSEDVDVTYDIRELAPAETAKLMEALDVIPESRSQQETDRSDPERAASGLDRDPNASDPRERTRAIRRPKVPARLRNRIR